MLPYSTREASASTPAPLSAANTTASSGSASTRLSPATRRFSTASTRLERPTYSGSRRESVNSAKPSGLERYELVSPEGMSSSVVVTGSMILEHTFKRIFSPSGSIAGHGLMLGPSTSSLSGLALPNPQYTRLS